MTQSWVIRETATGRPVCETWNTKAVAALNTARYEAVPVLQHLQELNGTGLASQWMRRSVENSVTEK